MLRNFIIESFTSGGGACEDVLLSRRSEFHLLMPRNEHHGDFSLSAPHDAAEYIFVCIVQAEKSSVGWTGSWINHHKCTGALHITHKAGERIGSTFGPYSPTVNLRLRTGIIQLLNCRLNMQINVHSSAATRDLSSLTPPGGNSKAFAAVIMQTNLGGSRLAADLPLFAAQQPPYWRAEQATASMFHNNIPRAKMNMVPQTSKKHRDENITQSFISASLSKQGAGFQRLGGGAQSYDGRSEI